MDKGHNTRSFTLLETLIAIALVLVLASVVIPLVSDALSERAFESAADGTSEQLVLARAHAQSTGEAVEVRYHWATSKVEAHRFAPWMPVFSPLASMKLSGPANVIRANSQRSADADICPEPETKLAGDDRAISEPWACRSLSAGVRIVDHRPVDANQNGDATISTTATSSSRKNSAATYVGSSNDLENDVRLAVFMPDGSALIGAPVWFNDDDGRIGKLTINPWTGLPVFERIEDFGNDPALAAGKHAADEPRNRVDGSAASQKVSKPDQPRTNHTRSGS